MSSDEIFEKFYRLLQEKDQLTARYTKDLDEIDKKIEKLQAQCDHSEGFYISVINDDSYDCLCKSCGASIPLHVYLERRKLQ